MISPCEDGRFSGGCDSCDACSGSQSYRELECVHTDDPGTRAWMDWFEAHGIPSTQVPWKGWVARDAERCTVSVKVHAWSPEDEAKPEFGVEGIFYPDRDDNGHYASTAARYGVYTVQLETAPLPFPQVCVPAPTDAEKEISAKLDRVIELLSDPLDFIRDALATAERPADVAVAVQPAVEVNS
jgi:hypothetical protein